MTTPFVWNFQKSPQTNSEQLEPDDTYYFPVGITHRFGGVFLRYMKTMVQCSGYWTFLGGPTLIGEYTPNHYETITSIDIVFLTTGVHNLMPYPHSLIITKQLKPWLIGPHLECYESCRILCSHIPWLLKNAELIPCIECGHDFNHYRLSVIIDNSSRMTLVTIINDLRSCCNAFHQVFPVHTWHRQSKDVKYPQNFINGMPHPSGIQCDATFKLR